MLRGHVRGLLETLTIVPMKKMSHSIEHTIERREHRDRAPACLALEGRLHMLEPDHGRRLHELNV